MNCVAWQRHDTYNVMSDTWLTRHAPIRSIAAPDPFEKIKRHCDWSNISKRHKSDDLFPVTRNGHRKPEVVSLELKGKSSYELTHVHASPVTIDRWQALWRHAIEKCTCNAKLISLYCPNPYFKYQCYSGACGLYHLDRKITAQAYSHFLY